MQCMHKWHLHIIYIYSSRIDISVYCLTFGLGPWNLQPMLPLFETPSLVLKYEGLELYCWQLALVPSSVVLIISRSSLTFVPLSTSTCNKSGFGIIRHTKLHPHTEFFLFSSPPSPDIPTYPPGSQNIPSQSALLKMMTFFLYLFGRIWICSEKGYTICIFMYIYIYQYMIYGHIYILYTYSFFAHTSAHTHPLTFTKAKLISSMPGGKTSPRDEEFRRGSDTPSKNSKNAALNSSLGMVVDFSGWVTSSNG